MLNQGHMLMQKLYMLQLNLMLDGSAQCMSSAHTYSNMDMQEKNKSGKKKEEKNKIFK